MKFQNVLYNTHDTYVHKRFLEEFHYNIFCEPMRSSRDKNDSDGYVKYFTEQTGLDVETMDYERKSLNLFGDRTIRCQFLERQTE